MKFNRYVSCIDTHCSGESTRILVGGVPKLKGKTMQEKQKYFQDHYDHLVGTMLKEPRGFSGMLGSPSGVPLGKRAGTGSLMENCVPRPGSLCSVIRPPWASMILRAVGSPRPEPPLLVE